MKYFIEPCKVTLSQLCACLYAIDIFPLDYSSKTTRQDPSPLMHQTPALMLYNSIQVKNKGIQRIQRMLFYTYSETCL